MYQQTYFVDKRTGTFADVCFRLRISHYLRRTSATCPW